MKKNWSICKGVAAAQVLHRTRATVCRKLQLGVAADVSTAKAACVTVHVRKRKQTMSGRPLCMYCAPQGRTGTRRAQARTLQLVCMLLL